MYKISNIISKEVVCAAKAIKVGTVYNVLFDKRLKKMTHLIITQSEDNMDNKYLLPVRFIHSIDNDIVLINSLTSFILYKAEYFNKYVPAILGKPCYNENGTLQGLAQEITTNDNFFTIEIIINNVGFLPNRIKSASNELMVLACKSPTRYNDISKSVTD